MRHWNIPEMPGEGDLISLGVRLFIPLLGLHSVHSAEGWAPDYVPL